jgi:hypothetical protein
MANARSMKAPIAGSCGWTIASAAFSARDRRPANGMNKALIPAAVRNSRLGISISLCPFMSFPACLCINHA